MSKTNIAAKVHADQEFVTAIATIIGVVVLLAVMLLATVWVVESGITLPYVPPEIA